MVIEAVHRYKKYVCFIAKIISSALVGWPLGLNPAAYSWKWMSDSVRDFALAVDQSIKSN